MTDVSATIVLASARPELAQLADPLRQQGYAVEVCGDGARALQLSLKLFPTLMIVDSDIPLLSAEKLAQILRSNPRTEGMGFFFVGREGEEIEGFRRHLDQFVLRPFNREQLLNSVLASLSRRERTEQMGRQEEEVAGSLDQISLADLLQVFGLNRKDGILRLRRGAERAVVFLLEGSVVDARFGRVRGEKAFFRLLKWQDGKFWFVPGAPGVEGRIATPLDHLLMEGMRQNDELAAQAGSLPAPGTRLALKASRERLPRGLRPATQEILLLLDNHHLVEDILDQSQRPDLEVLQILRVLLEKGLIEEVREAPHGEPLPLLTSGEVMAVRDYFNEGDVLLEEASAKLVLLCTRTGQLRAFLQALQGHVEFQPGGNGLPAGTEPGLGDVGRLDVGETFSLRLFCLPADAGTAPLWTPFSRRLFGVAALGERDEMAEAVSFFETDCHVPVARLRFSGSGTTDGFLLVPDDRRSLRRLLAFCASRFTGEPLYEEVS